MFASLKSRGWAFASSSQVTGIDTGAPVSMPLTWEELAKAHPLDFRITNALERLAETGDRWREAITKKQSLERALERAKA